MAGTQPWSLAVSGLGPSPFISLKLLRAVPAAPGPGPCILGSSAEFNGVSLNPSEVLFAVSGISAGLSRTDDFALPWSAVCLENRKIAPKLSPKYS